MNNRILLIEDNRSIMEIYKKILEEEGYIVTPVEDGLLAREEINRGEWDLMLLDVMLPKLDGLSLLKELSANTKLSSKPVLIISNVNEADFIAECKTYGIKEYIIKAEVLPSEILEKVALYLTKDEHTAVNNI
ncbi:response regulator [candidate division WWE3 bacterium]|uniref:Response regulator n=1 Tax=candidate division WWE3 bacterium TaxID=2053526 RepID=A0A7X9DKD5_UNCKA|nr:response regulator [candidate division WWE3 bacterium]